MVQLYLAQLTAVLAEVNRDSKKKTTPFSASDFILRVGKKRTKKQQISEDSLFGFFKAFAGARGGNNRNARRKG